MPRSTQEVFNELYEQFEAGNTITIELHEEVPNHGIRIGAVKDAALASYEEDCDDE